MVDLIIKIDAMIMDLDNMEDKDNEWCYRYIKSIRIFNWTS